MLELVYYRTKEHIKQLQEDKEKVIAEKNALMESTSVRLKEAEENYHK